MIKKAHTVKGFVDDIEVITVEPLLETSGKLENINTINDESLYFDINREFSPAENPEEEPLFNSNNTDFNFRYFQQNKLMNNSSDSQFYDELNQVWVQEILNTEQKILDYKNDFNNQIGQISKPDDVEYFNQIVNSNPVKMGPIKNFGALKKDGLTPIQRYNFKTNNTVVKIIKDEKSGDFYMCGTFTTVKGEAISKLCKVNKNGTVVNLNISIHGVILDMGLHGDNIIIVGKFTEVNGNDRENFAVINKNTYALTAHKMDTNNEIHTISIYNQRGFIVGAFTEVDSNIRNRVAFINVDDFTLRSDVLNTNDTVFDCFIDQAQDFLYLAGKFTDINTPTPNITISPTPTDGGTYYTVGNVLTVTGGDATVTVVSAITTGPITGFYINNGGNFYETGETLTAGNGSSFTVDSVDGMGSITSLGMISGGSGFAGGWNIYSLTYTGPGSGADAEIGAYGDASGQITAVSINSQPTTFGYTTGAGKATTGGSGFGGTINILTSTLPNATLYYCARVTLATMLVDYSWIPQFNNFVYNICDNGVSFFSASGDFTTINSNNCGKTAIIKKGAFSTYVKISDNAANSLYFYDDISYFSGRTLDSAGNDNKLFVSYDNGTQEFINNDIFFKRISYSVLTTAGKRMALFVDEENIFLNFVHNEFGNFQNVEPLINQKDYEIYSIGDNALVKSLNNKGIYRVGSEEYYEKYVDHYAGYVDFDIEDNSTLRFDLFRQLYNNKEINLYTNKSNQDTTILKTIVKNKNIKNVKVVQKVFPFEHENFSNHREDFIFGDWKDYLFDKYEKYSYILEGLTEFNYDNYRLMSENTPYKYTSYNPLGIKSKWPLESIYIKKGVEAYNFYFGELTYNDTGSLDQQVRDFDFNVPVNLSFDGFSLSYSVNKISSDDPSFFTDTAVVEFSDIFPKSNSKPFFNSEEEFSIFMKKKYRKYSTIMEYNSSEHIDELLNNEQIINIFTLTGSINNQLDFKINKIVDKNIKKIDFIFEYNELFRPYEEIYPLQQGLKLAAILSDTLNGNAVQMSYFYRPGIFWNSLMHSLPIHESTPLAAGNLPIDLIDLTDDDYNDKILDNIERIPFDTIYNPLKYLFDKSNRVIGQPTLSIFSSGTTQGYSSVEYDNLDDYSFDEKYSTIIQGFYSGINDFFLKNEKKVSINSKLENELPVFYTENTYGMKISIRRNVENINNVVVGDCGPSFWVNNGGLPWQEISPMHFPIYMSIISIGPKTIGPEELINFKIVFNPLETRKYTFSEIFDYATGTFLSTKQIETSDHNHLQNIQSCMDIFNFEKVDQTLKWTPTLKQEFPFLDHSDINSGNPIASENIDPSNIYGISDLKGYMRNYGKLSEGGLYIEISDILGNTKDKNNNNIIVTDSLADAFGINKENIPLGKLKDSKEISELVCLVPYDIKSEKNISIDIKSKNYLDNFKYFDKYIFPEKYDYVTGTPSPYLFYAFECAASLSTLDLSHIWQNVMPSQSFTFKEGKLILSENNADICKKISQPNIKWQIFKVKRRAKINNGKTSNYNWPYDFFSIVECGALSVETEFEDNE